jgi:DMSO/TMAO reductase YedYZ molybdopterin-dependent catalytic subunit
MHNACMKRLVDVRKTGVAKGVGRREFLLALASTGLASSYLRGQNFFLRQGIRPKPGNQTTPLHETIKGLITPNVDFYIRNHFETPKINSDAWNLQIGGLVSKPLQLSYSDLLLMSSVPGTFTVECAGNRSGGQGVGTAMWSGLPLAELLKQAGLKPGATTVVFQGADYGGGENVPPGTHFARAIPLEKAMDPSTLLAYEMNGEPLPADHGFPLRAIVPGWYGMDSVKWLTRIEVLEQPFKGYFQQEEYVAVRANGERRPITRILVSSKFLRPSEGEEILFKTYRVAGAAWAGERKIAKVELRVDNSAWQQVSLPASQTAMVWTPWSYEWHVSRPGQHTLEVRATDDEGHVQPDVRDPDRKDAYEVNTPHRVDVIVRS